MNELGLSNYIISNICDPVMRGLAATHLFDLRFADVQTAITNPSIIPDVVLLSLSPSNVTVVEFKPFVGKPPKILSSVLPTN